LVEVPLLAAMMMMMMMMTIIIITKYMRFVAFPATEFDEVFSGYQLGQLVEQRKNQRFEDHLCPRPQDRDGLRNVGFFHRSTN